MFRIFNVIWLSHPQWRAHGQREIVYRHKIAEGFALRCFSFIIVLERGNSSIHLSQSSSVMEVEGCRSSTAALLVGCACIPLDYPTFLRFLSLHHSSTALPTSHCASGGPVVSILTRLSSLSSLRQLRRFVLINFN